MQIHRIDIPTGGETPRSARTPGTHTDRGLVLSGSRENEAEGAVGGSELDALTRQLDGISDVRPDVVAAARVRVQRGDYLTRAAAEKTAAAILSKDV
jgi:hypothetical protein